MANHDGPDYHWYDADLHEPHHFTCECSLCKPELTGPVEIITFVPEGNRVIAHEVWRVEVDRDEQ